MEEVTAPTGCRDVLVVMGSAAEEVAEFRNGGVPVRQQEPERSLLANLWRARESGKSRNTSATTWRQIREEPIHAGRRNRSINAVGHLGRPTVTIGEVPEDIEIGRLVFPAPPIAGAANTVLRSTRPLCGEPVHVAAASSGRRRHFGRMSCQCPVCW